MTAHTKLTTKGQVVIPKDVRTRMGWEPGTDLEVTEAAGGIMLRPAADTRERITLAEFHRRVPPYKGKPLSLADMELAVTRLASRPRRGE